MRIRKREKKQLKNRKNLLQWTAKSRQTRGKEGCQTASQSAACGKTGFVTPKVMPAPKVPVTPGRAEDVEEEPQFGVPES